MLVLAAIETPRISDKLLGFLLGGLFILGALFFVVNLWMRANAAICVLCSESTLVVKNMFSTTSTLWEEISEFGTFTPTRSGHGGVDRIYYIKSRKQGDARIRVCDSSIQHIDELVDFLFGKAVNGQFLWIENLAWISFTKKLRTTSWLPNRPR